MENSIGLIIRVSAVPKSVHWAITKQISLCVRLLLKDEKNNKDCIGEMEKVYIASKVSHEDV